jgi:hypothetical protein
MLPETRTPGPVRVRLATRMICPQCRSSDCFRSHRDGVFDLLATFIGHKPWRCHTCDKRFYARRVAYTFSRYAHCSKCGNFDLERISRGRVEEGTGISLKRRLGIPAYRCELCRRRFFSVLSFRRIVPSTSRGAKPVSAEDPNPASRVSGFEPT